MASKRGVFFVLLIFLITLAFASQNEDLAKDYCESLDYEYVTQKTATSEVGFCKFSEYESCLAESFLRGECGPEYSSCAKKGYLLGISYGNEKLCAPQKTSKCAVCIKDGGTKIPIMNSIEKKKNLFSFFKILGFATCENCGGASSILKGVIFLIIVILIISLVFVGLVWKKRLSKLDKNKKMVLIALVILIIFLILVFVAFLVFLGSKTELVVGEGIETVGLENKNLHVKLEKEKLSDDVYEVEIELKDKSNQIYFTKVGSVEDSYDLKPEDFGVDDFADIKKVNVVYYYSDARNVRPLEGGVFDPDLVVEPIYESCSVDSDCDDNIACTKNNCFDGDCWFTPETSCDDGNVCNGFEYCDLEEGCSSSEPMDCSHLDDDCNYGTCSEEEGGCIKVPKLEGTACDDGILCTENFCSEGECIVDPEETCDDGVYCNGVEECLGDGECTNGTPVDCSHLDDECNLGVCSEELNNCTVQMKPNGTSCDDGGVCTLSDVCLSGVCEGISTDSVCDDGINCTIDSCEQKECVNVVDHGLCTDIEACSDTLGCVQNVCSGCGNCNIFFSDCNEDKCENSCNLNDVCYFTGNLNNLCIKEVDACGTKITECSNYSTQDCTRDFCEFGCKIENNACVEIDSCRDISVCSDIGTEEGCVTNECSIDCQWKNDACVNISLTHGTGGLEPGYYPNQAFYTNGVWLWYHLTVPESGGERSGMLIYMHGDGGKEYFNDVHSDWLDSRNLIVINVLSPYTSSSLGHSWRVGNTYLSSGMVNDLIQNEIYKKYNIDTDRIFFGGASGGSNFLTSSFIPYYGKYYSGGAIMLCGGLKPYYWEHPTQDFLDNFKLYFFTSKGDFLYAQAYWVAYDYQLAGFHVIWRFPDGGSHCIFPGVSYVDAFNEAFDLMDD